MNESLQIIMYTAIVSFSLALLLGFLLGFFQKVFYVPEDEKALKIREALPGVNCGACGYPGCDGFAKAVSVGDALPTGCPVGRAPVAEKIKAILNEFEASALEN